MLELICGRSAVLGHGRVVLVSSLEFRKFCPIDCISTLDGVAVTHARLAPDVREHSYELSIHGARQ